jgi:hypothetical protein
MAVRRLTAATLLAALAAITAASQNPDHISGHPRLWLLPKKLDFLRRERERQSVRWRQFESVVRSSGTPAEPGLVYALYARVAAEPDYCRKAVDCALTVSADLRQKSLVFDWCVESTTQEQSDALAGQIENRLRAMREASSIYEARDSLLAAVALAGHRQDAHEEDLRAALSGWWESRMVDSLQDGRDVIARDDMLALAEILHTARDNLKLDLRESARLYFDDLPGTLLLSYYPRRYAADGHEYYLPATKVSVPLEARRGFLARSADLALLAYDATSQPQQFLQGWLMREDLRMRDSLGAIYEFLWANPYQPGLSYRHFPLFFHNRSAGQVFMRSSWEDAASWLCWTGSELLYFNDGVPGPPPRQAVSKPFHLGDAALYFVAGTTNIRVMPPEVNMVFFAGLKPNGTYSVEISGDKKREMTSDSGGVLAIGDFKTPGASIRIREVRGS